jgi:GH24 family phage-related lysozyme (muramidase)
MRGLVLAALMLPFAAHPAAQEPDLPASFSSPIATFAPLPATVVALRPPQAMSERGILFLKAVEGFRSTAYHDIGGGYSIGYGFRKWKGRRVTLAYPQRVTEEQAAAELRRQLSTYEDIVRREFGGRIPQHSFDGLVSLCFNLGRLNTAILRKVRTDRPVGIHDFLTTAAVRSRFHLSLYSRRVREFAMFVGRYEDALDPDLRSWTAARIAHQNLLGHSLRIVSERDVRWPQAPELLSPVLHGTGGAPPSAAPGVVAAALPAPSPNSAGR